MYTKAESKALKTAFWTAFGAYMKPVPNADGVHINWINYKTGVKHIYFRIDVSSKTASIAIELKHTIPAERVSAFQKFESLKKYFQEVMDENWEWQTNIFDEDGSAISRISVLLPGVNIFIKDQWPHIIAFLKERLIKLDTFWQEVKFRFEAP